MPDIRAKMFVSACTITSGGTAETGSVSLQAVTRGAVNRSFSSATPSGKIDMHISNPVAFAFFRDRIGREFYVDFTEYHPVAGDGHKFVATVSDGPNKHYNEGRCVDCGQDEAAHA